MVYFRIWLLSLLCVVDALLDFDPIIHEDNMNRSSGLLDDANGCFWGGTNPCFLDCMSGSSLQLSSTVETLWNERPQCHLDGIGLRISSGVTFNNWILPARFFTANVKLTTLNMQFRNFDTVETDAFATDAFKTVESFTIEFTSTIILHSGTFNGLESLKSLIFSSSTIRGFTSGVLDSVANTLTDLTYIETTRFNSPLLVDGLTGGAPMTALTSVKFTHNLVNTITQRTFVGLVAVTRLDLSSCQIEVIGPRSFHPISNSIEVLNLQTNRIKMLPPGLFDLMLPRNGIRVNINSNEFHCDCELCYIKWLLKRSFFTSSSLPCRTPTELRDYPIDMTNFCFDEACEDYSPEVILPTPPTGTTLLPTPPTNGNNTNIVIQQCYEEDQSLSSETISIKTPDQVIHITQNHPGEVVISLDAFQSNFVIIWFDGDTKHIHREQKDEINCRDSDTHFAPQKINIRNLQMNKNYIFCLMDKESITVSPLNCVPHYEGSEQSADNKSWMAINVNSKDAFISVLVPAIIASILFGFLLSYCWIRQRRIWLRHRSKLSQISKTEETIERTTAMPNLRKIELKRHHSEGSITSISESHLKINRLHIEEVKPYQTPKLQTLEEDSITLKNVPSLITYQLPSSIHMKNS